METRIVKLIYPHEPTEDLIKLSASKIPIFKKHFTVYDTVDFFLNNVFLKSKFEMSIKLVLNKILVSGVINLHNDTGIKDKSKIISMAKQIISGNDVFNNNGLPNVRLVKTKEDLLVLFDGHHTTLAYMLTGRKYLHEIPHLIVSAGERGYVSDKEICAFFGEHANKVKGNDWREKVINWHTKKEKQLCKRVQRNMGELFNSLNIKFRN
jgi:hypothetical protein